MRVRLLVGTVVLTLVSITAFFIPAALTLVNAQREAQVVELQREASEAAAALGTSEGTNGSVGTGEEVDRTEHLTPEHDYASYDLAGRLIEGRGPPLADAPVQAALQGHALTLQVGAERVAAVPLASGGAVRAAEPVEEVDERIRSAVLGLAGVALLVLVGGIVAAWFLSRRLTLPLRRLATSAMSLGGGDFTATAQMTGVSEIDDVAAALNSSAERIGGLVTREQQLTEDISHQLRTPLAGLRIALEGELADPRSDRTIVVREALGAVDRLDTTVSSLTELARARATGEPFAADDAVTDAIRRWHQTFKAAGRELRSIAESEALTSAHGAAIAAILDVLLDNALRHGRGSVTITSRDVPGAVDLLVSDEGHCELSDAEMFTRHYSDAGGTGVGLDLARTLASAEGARIRLSSGAPTTFRLQVPLSD